MVKFEDWCNITSDIVNNHDFKVFFIDKEKMTQAIDEISHILPHHYVDPDSIADTLLKLGKPAAAQKLRTKLPEAKRIRSGDLGEILATEYIENQTVFTVYVKKLRWKDHREMALRGDDVIGIEMTEKDGLLFFLKTEVKSRVALSQLTFQEARIALDTHEGKPSPHGLEFIAEQLRLLGNVETADKIEKSLLVQGISIAQVKHMIFTLTQSNPDTLQKSALKDYPGSINQTSVCLRVKEHQKFITDIFAKVNDDINS